MGPLKRLRRRRPVADPEAQSGADLQVSPGDHPDDRPDENLDDNDLEDGPGDYPEHEIDSDGAAPSRLATLRRTSAAVTSRTTTVATTAGRATVRRVGRSQTWGLIRAAHPRQGVLTAFGVATAVAFIDRPAREVAVVFLTVLVGQTVLGWHNDLVDRHRDARHLAEGRASGKPVADGTLDPGTVWFALACAVLLLIPLSVTTGLTAASCYLLSVGVGVLGNLVLRMGIYSWVPWALAYALLPAYVAFGGWGGSAEGRPPVVAMTLLVAALGVGVHGLRALFGLVADHADGWTYWPLILSLRLGAPRMLLFTGIYLAVVTVAIIVVGATVGLRQ